MEKIIYTHDEAAAIIEMFEDILCRSGIKVPSPEDDERTDDVGLYGSTYSDLLGNVESYLIDFPERAKDAEIIPDVFSGKY